KWKPKPKAVKPEMVWKPVNNEKNAKIKIDREFNEMNKNIEKMEQELERIKQNRLEKSKEFRRMLIEINKPKESYIKIKNIANKRLFKNQIKNTVIDVVHYPIMENTVNIIGEFVWNQYQLVINGLNRNEYPGGFNSALKLYFIDPVD